MQTKCKLCHLNIDIDSPNYILNNNCQCSFHYKYYENHFPNYFSIYFPNVPTAINTTEKKNFHHTKT